MARYYGATAPSELGSHEARVIELVRLRGFAELPEVLSTDQIADYSTRLDAVYAQQEAVIGHEALEAIGEANVARCPLAYDSAFLDLALEPRVLALVRAVLGSYVILHLQNGILVEPRREHHQSAWHRDLPYQEYVSSRPLALNVLYCLEDFAPETGGTLFLPFSHREEELPSLAILELLAEQPRVPAGSAVVFDSMVFHRAGRNTSTRIRRGVNHVYTTGILRQQIDIPGWLPRQNPELHDRVMTDPDLQQLLGYDARTADSVEAFRQRRLDKLMGTTATE